MDDDRETVTYYAEDAMFLFDTIIWMSGSDDFSADGPAGAEWARRRKRVFDVKPVED